MLFFYTTKCLIKEQEKIEDKHMMFSILNISRLVYTLTHKKDIILSWKVRAGKVYSNTGLCVF